MRESRWIVLEKCEIGRRSERFTVKYGDRVEEVAAVNTSLLVIDSDFKISIEAIRLASKHNITIFIIHDGRYVWLTQTYVKKNIEYVLNQYSVFRKGVLKEVFRKAVRQNILKLNRYLGLNQYNENIVEIVSSIRNIDSKILIDIENYFRLFIIAECLDAIIRSGLSPFISISRFLPEDVEEMFHYPVIWYSILNIDEEILYSHNLNSYSYRRTILKYLRERLNQEVYDIYGYRRKMSQHIRSYVKSLASHVLNPITEFKPFIVD